MTTILGIDLGGISAAKTAISVWRAGHISLVRASEVHRQSLAHPQGIEQGLIELIEGFAPDLVGIDAPLSLPDVTTQHYYSRPADIEVGAQSPFRLGLPRALYLHHLWQQRNQVHWVEVYPRSVLRYLGLPETKYKTDTARLATVVATVLDRYAWALDAADYTADEVDSLLALVAAWHYAEGRSRTLAGTAPPFVVPI